MNTDTNIKTNIFNYDSNYIKNNLSSIRMNYIYMFIIYLILLVILYFTNPLKLMSEYTGITLFITIFMGFLLVSIIIIYSYILNNKTNIKLDNFTNILFSSLFLIIGLIGSGLFIYFIIKSMGLLEQDYSKDNKIGKLIFTIFFIILGLGIIYQIINFTDIFNKSPLLNMITNILFYIPCKLKPLFTLLFHILIYIPCLFTNLFTKIFGINNTIAYFSLLIFITILFFILIYYIIYSIIEPYIIKTYRKHGCNMLVYNSINLNNENNIAIIDNLEKKNKEDYSFGLSILFNIDSYPLNTNNNYLKKNNILTYGKFFNIDYDPKNQNISINIINDKDKKIIIFIKDKILLQKWNNIIINYNSGIFDIFYNNKLVKSQNGIIPTNKFSRQDYIIIGNNNGIYGKVKEILYCKEPIDILLINQINNPLI
jgi:hypothetical protein